MTTAVAARPGGVTSFQTASAAVEDRPRSRSGGGRLTLEQRLDSVWEGLRATGAADCPVCGGAMEHANHAAECRDCGSALS
jgi:hypothetical protein